MNIQNRLKKIEEAVLWDAGDLEAALNCFPAEYATGVKKAMARMLQDKDYRAPTRQERLMADPFAQLPDEIAEKIKAALQKRRRSR